MKQRILIVEDEAKYARVLQLELENEGYGAAVRYDGAEGLQTALAEDFDLILLDLMLPQKNGLEILQEVKRAKAVPVIILTARDQVMDKVKGHDTGADYYLTKPCAIEELLACIRNLLKRNLPHETAVLKCGPLEINLGEHSVVCAGQSVGLTKKEYDLLVFLVRNKNAVITREKILSSVWEYDFYGDTNIVDVYIRYLRGKLDDKLGVKLIETLRGAGYIIRDS
ncbi:DNA-binding response regulator [Clostridia bacterium]|nr:DNA-binding response regulator [Clostridia bacterium]